VGEDLVKSHAATHFEGNLGGCSATAKREPQNRGVVVIGVDSMKVNNSSFTVKVLPPLYDVNSAQVRAWLSGCVARGNVDLIIPDPGAGDCVLRLSLPKREVKKLARALRNPPAVALRRLIATYLKALPIPSPRLAPAALTASPSRSEVLATQRPASPQTRPPRTYYSLTDAWERSRSALPLEQWAAQNGFAHLLERK